MDLIYNYRFDSKNLDGFLNLHSQDAIWEAFLGGSSSPSGVLDTPDEGILATADRIMADSAQAMGISVVRFDRPGAR